ncbi:MAG: hypothetical protein JO366_05710, partial [Methylobacteriaceae bacterium]|nr:hypothetical protein [Methylobacteriaceae bacterium]
MTNPAPAVPRMRTPHRDLSAFLDAIDGVPTIRDPVTVRRRSRDFFWYSPI